jgi:hypothetical protein
MAWAENGAGKPITGYTFKAQFKESYESTQFITELSSEDGGFVITDAALGKFSMVFRPDQTALFPVPLKQKKVTDIPFKEFVFDVDVIPADNTKPTCLIKGVVKVYAEVTP